MRLVYPTVYELWDIQDRMGIDRRTFVAYFEVQVRAGGGTAGHANISNYIPLADTLSAGYRGRASPCGRKATASHCHGQ